MKKFVIAISAALVFSGVAGAQIVQSPARDLYDQATFYVESEYWGFSTKNIPALIQTGSDEIEKICGVDPLCPFAKAEPVLEKLFEAIEDKHSNYYNPQQAASIFGSLGGGGVATPNPVWGFVSNPDFAARATRVFDVFPGSPAEKAGLKYRDLIIGYNGKQFGTDQNTFLTEFRATNALGNEMELTVKRGEQTITLKGTPAVYQNRSLPWLEEISPGVLRMRVPSFDNPNTAQVIHDLAAQAMTKNPKALILDMRDNGGGLATECIMGVGAFIGKVERVRSQRRGGRNEVYENGVLTFKDTVRGTERAVKTIKHTNYVGKISVLVNKGSASCAEYFPSDIKYAKRAPVIGEKTVGVGNTGTIIFPLLNGGGAQVTVVKAIRVDGTEYPEAVTPDVEIADARDVFAKTGVDAVMDSGIAQAR
ncbi:MAG: hypothetical protein RLZZ156_1015 [Deinococcota bacterium]|jgi:carboxyl-terminal processing protease